MANPLTDAELRSYLSRALTILNAFAGEGISIEGHEEPEDLLMDFFERIDLGDGDWPDAIATLNP